MRGRLGEIDALRLIAALAVLVFHVAAAAGFPKRTMPPISVFGRTFSDIPSVFTFGATGVSLFFVISGYCLYRSLDGANWTMSSYYRARIARIWPAYAVAVVFSVAVCFYRGLLVTPLDVLTKLLLAQGFIQQYHLTLNGALWSMATEAQFYIALPFLFLLFARIRPLPALAILVTICIAYRFALLTRVGDGPVAGGISQSAFLLNLLPGRLAEFAFGMFLAVPNVLQRVRRAAIWLSLPLLLLGGGFKAIGPLWLAEPVLGLAYAAILATMIGLNRIPETSLLASGGRASFSLFLFHEPILQMIVHIMPLDDLAPYPRFVGLLVATLLISLPVAAFVYLKIELPMFKRFGRRSASPAQVAPW